MAMAVPRQRGQGHEGPAVQRGSASSEASAVAVPMAVRCPAVPVAVAVAMRVVAAVRAVGAVRVSRQRVQAVPVPVALAVPVPVAVRVCDRKSDARQRANCAGTHPHTQPHADTAHAARHSPLQAQHRSAASSSTSTALQDCQVHHHAAAGVAGACACRACAGSRCRRWQASAGAAGRALGAVPVALMQPLPVSMTMCCRGCSSLLGQRESTVPVAITGRGARSTSTSSVACTASARMPSACLLI